MNLTKLFLTKKFKEYYQEAEIELPNEFERREFAIVPLEYLPEFVMIRHLSFRSQDDFRSYILSRIPAHIYYSSAYYEYPNKEMEKKGWIKADLIFDIDADHLPVKTSFEKLLEIARREVKKLLTILKRDFGISEEFIRVYFSGSRGYHIHVMSEEYSYLSSAERREIIDYITVNNPKVFNGDTFYNSNIASRVAKYVKRKLNLNSDKIPKKHRREVEEIVDRALQKMRVHIDSPVTADVKRLIRLPNSLHGKTGLKVTEVEDLDSFNPFKDSIVFSDNPVEVTVLKNSRVNLGDFKSKLYAGERIKVPEYVAIFLMCRGEAKFG